MSRSDDELRELFRGHRDADRGAAPRFESVWARARQKSAHRTRVRVGVLVGGAAAIAILAFVRTNDDPQPLDPAPTIARTAPVEPAQTEPAGAAATFESWEEETWSTPTDFLLEEEGVLAGGIPMGDVFDEEHWTEM